MTAGQARRPRRCLAFQLIAKTRGHRERGCGADLARGGAAEADDEELVEGYAAVVVEVDLLHGAAQLGRDVLRGAVEERLPQLLLQQCDCCRRRNLTCGQDAGGRGWGGVDPPAALPPGLCRSAAPAVDTPGCGHTRYCHCVTTAGVLQFYMDGAGLRTQLTEACDAVRSYLHEASIGVLCTFSSHRVGNQ